MILLAFISSPVYQRCDRYEKQTPKDEAMNTIDKKIDNNIPSRRLHQADDTCCSPCALTTQKLGTNQIPSPSSHSKFNMANLF